jgi:hypothetical protein
MKNLENILTEITQLTTNIETNYPELYPFLEENPMTIPSTNQPDINLDIMQNYLESLKQLLKHHQKTRRNTK